MSKLKKLIFDHLLLFTIIFYLIFIFGIFFFSEHINSANFNNGYILGGDSSRYIKGAIKLKNFEFPSGKASSYLGYIFFLSIFQYFNLSLTFVVISQIFLTILSALCIYKISQKFSSNIGGLFAVILYLFYFPIQIRNFYILTETLFICSIIFTTYFLIFFKKKYLIILMFLIFFTILIRPHGLLIIPAIFSSILIWCFLNNKTNIFYIFILILIVSIYPTFSILNIYLENMKIIENIINMGIIYGYDHKDNFVNYNVQNYQKNDFLSLLHFFNNNIENFITAFFKKLYLFFFRVRPYYSEAHNLYIILFNFICYPLAIFGLIKLNSEKNLGIYFIYSLIVFFIIGICMSFVDWSGRFSLYILPFILLFSGIGFDKLFKKVIIKIDNK